MTWRFLNSKRAPNALLFRQQMRSAIMRAFVLRHRIMLSAILSSCLALGACGGGGGGSESSSLDERENINRYSVGPVEMPMNVASVAGIDDDSALVPTSLDLLPPSLAEATPTQVARIDDSETVVDAAVKPAEDTAERPPALPPAASPAAKAPGSSPSVLLAGTGLTNRLASDCKPRLANDFIDSGDWNKRRLMPRDCLQVMTNPPAFSWLQPPDRDKSKPWTFSLRPRNGSGTSLSTASVVPRLMLPSALQPGSYEWWVSYTNKAGKAVTSEARRFAVAENAPVVVFPNGSAVTRTVLAKPQPRVLPRGSSFASLALAANQGDLANAYSSLIATADTALSAPLPGSSSDPAFDYKALTMSSVLDMQALRRACDTEKRYLEALGYAYRFTGDKRYLNAGVKRILNLSAWAPNGATSEKNFDYCNRAVYSALALALDLYAPDLSRENVRAIVSPLSARLAQAIARFNGLDTAPYDSQVDTIMWSVLAALMHSAGTPGFDESIDWLTQTWDLVVSAANPWGADDGGFGNGITYGWFRLHELSAPLAAVRVIADVNLARHPSLAGLGDFLIAFSAARGRHATAFGDGSSDTSHYANFAHNGYRLYAQLTGNPLHRWYWQMGSAAVNPKSNSVSPWHFMLQGIATSTDSSVPPANSWAFDDAGVTAMHNDAARPDRSSVYFRASEFGSAVHSHADQNSFTFVSKGKDLLISGGYYTWFGSPHHTAIARATRYKNALTFDGGIGQAEAASGPVTAPGKPIYSRNARGRLLNHADDGTWAVSTGDASLAYRSANLTTSAWTPLLNDAIRTVAYNRIERTVIVYDYATSSTPRRWELNFNSVVPFQLDGARVRLDNGGAAACIEIAGNAGMFSTSSGFDVQPEVRLPNQFQARYTAGTKSEQLVTVTVIREDCHTKPINVSFGPDTSARVSISGGPPIVFDKNTVKLP